MPRSHVGETLRHCRKVQAKLTGRSLSREELATQMIAEGFPVHEYTTDPHGSAANILFLAARLKDIERFPATAHWPFPQHRAEFIETVARCLPRVLKVQSRLDMANALDAFEESGL